MANCCAAFESSSVFLISSEGAHHLVDLFVWFGSIPLEWCVWQSLHRCAHFTNKWWMRKWAALLFFFFFPQQYVFLCICIDDSEIENGVNAQKCMVAALTFAQPSIGFGVMRNLVANGLKLWMTNAIFWHLPFLIQRMGILNSSSFFLFCVCVASKTQIGMVFLYQPRTFKIHIEPVDDSIGSPCHQVGKNPFSIAFNCSVDRQGGFAAVECLAIQLSLFSSFYSSVAKKADSKQLSVWLSQHHHEFQLITVQWLGKVDLQLLSVWQQNHHYSQVSTVQGKKCRFKAVECLIVTSSSWIPA